jgi:acyl-CoA dehydrogenase
MATLLVFTVIIAALTLVIAVPPVRRRLVSPFLLKFMSGYMPRVSDTEKLALEAGTVWWDRDLFSGHPDWQKLIDFHPNGLTPAEEAFLDGPVNRLCGMVDDWQARRDGDLPAAAWEYMKSERFFGMIIPERFGGLGFSAVAHSAVITRLSTRSVAAAVTVMVPNSLGPAELLLHYGTDEQKNRYLPRLAYGEEIPCFALTEPLAGSDAASGHSTGVICRSVWEGRETLGMRLDWDKRYATLAPVATVIGLAFKLHDPDHLLGDREDLGITCALIPAHLPGVEIGERHDPLGVPFLNGPTRGHGVFVPLDAIIGGPAMAGQGWRMLMESLAAGRSISLPALAAGAAQISTRVTGAYATVREQFGMSIGGFEGIEEKLGPIGGFTYLMNAARTLTAAAVDAGEKPSVLSAVAKAYMTEFMRVVVNDAMDVTAGAGISRGPRNTLAGGYIALPIGITVEGANILTRSLIIFGQGAIRCHPWVLEEMHAVEARDVARFDRAFFGHLAFTVSNMRRSIVGGLTGARFARPGFGGPLQAHFGHFARLSASFSFLADVCMASLGASLKRHEMVSGRMADALAWMFFGSATLKRFVDEGCPPADLPLARYASEKALFETEHALSGVLDNFPRPWIGRALRPVLFPLGARHRAPSDRRVREAARCLVNGAEGRVRLTPDVFLPSPSEPGLGSLEAALAGVLAARPIEAKLREAVRGKRIRRASRLEMVTEALAAGIISEEEARRVREADAAREEAVQVDAFPAGTLSVQHRERADSHHP